MRTADGAESLARAPGRELPVVCGDEVECQLDRRHDELRISGASAPRRGALYRSNARGGGELIAANLSLLLVVVAPLPVPDFFIVDRYLAAASAPASRAAVLLNKSDLRQRCRASSTAAVGIRSAAGYAAAQCPPQQPPAWPS